MPFHHLSPLELRPRLRPSFFLLRRPPSLHHVCSHFFLVLRTSPHHNSLSLLFSCNTSRADFPSFQHLGRALIHYSLRYTTPLYFLCLCLQHGRTGIFDVLLVNCNSPQSWPEIPRSVTYFLAPSPAHSKWHSSSFALAIPPHLILPLLTVE